MGAFGTVFVSLGTILTATTLYLAVDASYAVMLTKESKSLKRNVFAILSIYPIASLCSLLALAIPRYASKIETMINVPWSCKKCMALKFNLI